MQYGELGGHGQESTGFNCDAAFLGKRVKYPVFAVDFLVTMYVEL
jgi:hypothetical protein